MQRNWPSGSEWMRVCLSEPVDSAVYDASAARRFPELRIGASPVRKAVGGVFRQAAKPAPAVRNLSDYPFLQVGSLDGANLRRRALFTQAQ
jgi:hypothetical protein